MRVAMEIAGKGVGIEGKNGEPVGDSIEPTNSVVDVEETQNECVECEMEKIMNETIAHVISLQESLNFEMNDDDISFAMDLYLEQNIPGREVGNTDHHHTDGQKRDKRGKIETFLRNYEAGYIKRKYAQAQNIINPPGTPPEEVIPVTRSEVMSDIMKSAGRRMEGDLKP